MRLLATILLLLLLAAGGFLLWQRGEGEAPRAEAPERIVLGREARPIEVRFEDAASGLRRVQAEFEHPNGKQSLLDESFSGNPLLGGPKGRDEAVAFTLQLDPAGLPPTARDATLRLRVHDWTWRNALHGNELLLEIPVEIDLRAPLLTIHTGLSYLRQGGAGVVVYNVSEPVLRDGVEVDDRFYPGYALEDSNRRVAFFALAADGASEPSIRVVAEDAAGNVGSGRWQTVVKPNPMPEENVELPARFLTDVAADLAQRENIDTADLAAAFAKVNTEVRARNEAKIRELSLASAPQRLWSGPFRQLANSQVMSGFAQRRSYVIGGVFNSNAIHYGYDLASLRQSPIAAANSGRVVHADELGIYGNCVILDHGLGLTSLYAHLSRIDVAVGDLVSAGQTLGLSGATGLAGGDHLHYAMLVSGTYVDPIEWWDPKWIDEKIDAQFELPVDTAPLPPAAPAATAPAAAAP